MHLQLNSTLVNHQDYSKYIYIYKNEKKTKKNSGPYLSFLPELRSFSHTGFFLRSFLRVFKLPNKHFELILSSDEWFIVDTPPLLCSNPELSVVNLRGGSVDIQGNFSVNYGLLLPHLSTQDDLQWFYEFNINFSSHLNLCPLPHNQLINEGQWFYGI